MFLNSFRLHNFLSSIYIFVFLIHRIKYYRMPVFLVNQPDQSVSSESIRVQNIEVE